MPKPDLRDENERLKIENACFRIYVANVTKDKNMKCMCGEEPYTDGDQCIRCWGIEVLAMFSHKTKKIASYKKRFLSGGKKAK